MEEHPKVDKGFLTPPQPRHRNRANSAEKGREISHANSPISASPLAAEFKGKLKQRGIHFADENMKPLETELGVPFEAENPERVEQIEFINETHRHNSDMPESDLKVNTCNVDMNSVAVKQESSEDEPISGRFINLRSPGASAKDIQQSTNQKTNYFAFGETLPSPTRLEKKAIHFSNDVLVADEEMKESHQNLNDSIGNSSENFSCSPFAPPELSMVKSPSFTKDTLPNQEYNPFAPPSETNQLDYTFAPSKTAVQGDSGKKGNNSELRRRAGSVNSRASSENSEDEPLDEEDKNFIIKTRERIEIMWEWPSVRQIRFYFASYRFNLIMTFSFFLVITIFIFSSTMLIPGILLRSIDVYDGIHIGTILSGHLLFMCGNQLLKSIHKGIVCSMVAHKGASVSEIQSGYLSSHAPGGRLRQFIFFVSVVLGILLSFLSLNYQWVPAETLFMSGQCIPATYPTASPIYTNLGDFMQGDIDFALVYQFGIPLEDGLIGGWSSWPMLNPYPLFSMDGEGFAYAIFTSCAYPYPAHNITANYTKVWLTESSKTNNILEGKITVFLPNASIQSDVDIGFGVYQDCTFITKFGKGDIRMSFVSDEWQMVTINGIEEIKVGTSTIQARASTGRTFIEFFDQLKDDKYDLTSRYQDVLKYVYNGREFEPSQGAAFSNIISEATLPDGYYHETEMWKGISVALATPAHYVLMQFDPTLIANCNYYGEVGAGIFNVPLVWMTIIQVLLIILMAVCSMNVWWMYLMFEINMATDVAYISMSTKMGMAAAFAKETSVIFESYSPNTESLDADLSKKLGKMKIYFGVDIDTLENEVKEVKYGQKHKIIFLKKHFKREEKRLKMESKLRRRTSIKDANAKPKLNSQSNNDEIPKLVIQDDVNPAPPAVYLGRRRSSAAFEKKTFVRENSKDDGIIKSSVMSPSLSTPTTPKGTLPNPRLAAVREDANRSGGSLSSNGE
ncbi:hypothetical protein HDV06_000852 [Boothiomyces sp. JEL0866]|nr:hypothetical protein HDV06_000843 [Boothiomyces sp. JEL0866]KAJ3318083.1 hypothetical protein HDV06_000852 [Boothiomyces sp. JEL0866]